MWTEISRANVLGITDFAKVQQSCSDYYLSEMTPTLTIQRFISGDPNLRAFVWRDANYEINLAATLKGIDTLQLKIIGIRKCADVTTAAGYTLAQIKTLLGVYGVKKFWAIWGSDVHTDVQAFYQATAAGLAGAGFINISLVQPRALVYQINAGIA